MRTMRRSFIQCLLSFLLIPAWQYSANAQCPASSPLVINSITPAESRCAASGSATVSASGGSTPYTYSITAGPVTAAAQSSNVLQSLQPGTYTVQVTDNCGTSVNGSVTIPGTYTIPSPTFTTTTTSCPGSSDGSITVTVPNGRAPLTYALISPSPVMMPAQAGNVFTGLPAGTYTVQVGDSCGNIQTRPVTVPAGSSGNVSFYPGVSYVSCDTYTISLNINVTNPNDFRPPFTTSVALPDGTVLSHVLTNPTATNGTITDTYTFTYHHNTGAADWITPTVTNNCGASYQYPLSLENLLDMSPSVSPGSACGGYTYTFDAGNSLYIPVSQLHCSPLTYTLVSPAGVVLATQTNNSSFTGYPPGNGYTVIRTDCCGSESLTFDWATPTPSFQISGNWMPPYGTCQDNTAALILYFSNVLYSTGQIIIESGPPSVTLADGTVHAYTYPITINAYDLNYGQAQLYGLTAGTYDIVTADACGREDSAMITIPASALRHDSFTATGVKGCPNANQIQLNAATNAAPGYFTIATITANGSTVADVTNSPFGGSATGLTAGTYYVSYNYQRVYGSYPMPGMGGCDVITDTVVIPSYTQPAFSATPAVANCGSIRDVALLPDTTSGLPPYEYQIIGGPTTTADQSSPVFTGLSTGTYTFQMTDACANSYSRNITIDTLAVPGITASGGTCAGDAATLALPASPFYTYSWQHPDGTTSTGDTLSISPITAADTGNYTVTVTSTVGGCTSSSSTTVSMAFCAVLDEAALHFSGQRIDGTIRLNWRSGDLAGIQYYIVERSVDGITFEPIEELTATGATGAAAATGATYSAYSATDNHPPAGTVFYRLQITDKSGAVAYSQTLSFSNANTQPVNVYPRLITGNTTVTVTHPDAEGFIRVIGVDGTIYRTYLVPPGSTQTMIDLAGLAQGAWFVTYTGNGVQTAIEVWKE